MAVLKDKKTKALDREKRVRISALMHSERPVADALRRKLEAAFQPLALTVEDESARHAGHAGAREGGESHFRVRIVSQGFRGLSRVERQRRVYDAVKDEIAAGLHALALTTLTPEEAGRQPPHASG